MSLTGLIVIIALLVCCLGPMLLMKSHRNTSVKDHKNDHAEEG